MTLQSDIKQANSKITQLQSEVNTLKSKINSMESEMILTFPRMTKLQFRNLLTDEQKIFWDNWSEMDLGLTQEEKWQLNTFFKTFDLAQNIDLTDMSLLQGMSFIVSKGIITQEEAQRILSGEPVFIEPEEEIIDAGEPEGGE